MARVELAPEVGADLDRILEHLERQDAAHVVARLREIIDALGVLETNPLIGRPAHNDKRELVIGHGPHGYVALYRHVPAFDTVFVLAVMVGPSIQRDKLARHGPTHPTRATLMS